MPQGYGVLVVHIESGAVDIRDLAYIRDRDFFGRVAFQKLKISVLYELFGHADAPVICHCMCFPPFKSSVGGILPVDIPTLCLYTLL